MIGALIFIPFAAGAAAFAIRADRPRRALLVLTAAVHAALSAAALGLRPPPVAGGWLGLDAAGLLFLLVTSGLFLAAAVYAVMYLAREGRGARTDPVEGIVFVNGREATFTGCLLLFLSTMTLVVTSRHFGLLWVAVEATTLVSAPLILFHRHHRSLEATWKYLMLCSVGIAIALLGNFFLAAAASGIEHGMPMTIDALRGAAARLNPSWLGAAFVLFLVGYGTKMGLAPLHTWLPDAHSEAPSVVSALLSGALLNCAFLALLRVQEVCGAAGLSAFCGPPWVLLGLVSLALAAVFIAGQPDYKRMLAYSSVEHMGILAFGIGLGGLGRSGALLHAVNHSMAKAMLFLVAGNLLAAYRTKQGGEVRGAVRRLAVSGPLWIAGFLAITGSPPFGTFVSEMTILRAAFTQGRPLEGSLYLLALVVVFAAMGAIVLKMAHGPRPDGAERVRESSAAWGPPLALGLGVLCLGLWIPPALTSLIGEAAAALGGP